MAYKQKGWSPFDFFEKALGSNDKKNKKENEGYTNLPAPSSMPEPSGGWLWKGPASVAEQKKIMEQNPLEKLF